MHKTLLLIATCFCFIFLSCSKQPGLGGKASVNIHVIKSIDQNSSLSLTNTTVHVNYGGTSFLGVNAIGNDTKNTNESGVVVFENLKRGNYYFFVNTLVNDTLISGGHFTTIESKRGEQHIVIDLGQEDPF